MALGWICAGGFLGRGDVGAVSAAVRPAGCRLGGRVGGERLLLRSNVSTSVSMRLRSSRGKGGGSAVKKEVLYISVEDPHYDKYKVDPAVEIIREGGVGKPNRHSKLHLSRRRTRKTRRH